MFDVHVGGDFVVDICHYNCGQRAYSSTATTCAPSGVLLRMEVRTRYGDRRTVSIDVDKK